MTRVYECEEIDPLDLIEFGDEVTDLYRHYDSRGRLLYVGISGPGSTVRLNQHRRSGHWYHQVERVEVEKHLLRDHALACEALAIEYEKPLYNKARPHLSIKKSLSRKLELVLSGKSHLIAFSEREEKYFDIKVDTINSINFRCDPEKRFWQQIINHS